MVGLGSGEARDEAIYLQLARGTCGAVHNAQDDNGFTRVIHARYELNTMYMLSHQSHHGPQMMKRSKHACYYYSYLLAS